MKEKRDVIVRKANRAVKQPREKAAQKKEIKPQAEPENWDALFRAAYLESARKACANARRLGAERSGREGFYYREKGRFLENMIGIIEGSGEVRTDWDKFWEPFFWNELKRVSNTLYNNFRIKGDQEANNRCRKAAKDVNKIIAANLNEAWRWRHGFVLQSSLVSLKRLAFHVSGAMLYLEKDIAANPDNEDLPRLRNMYEMFFKKSGMDDYSRKIALWHRSRGKEPDWKNPETAAYFMERALSGMPDHGADAKLSLAPKFNLQP